MQVERLQSTVRDRRAGYTQSLNVLRHAKQARVGIQHSHRFRCTAYHCVIRFLITNTGFRTRTAQEFLMADKSGQRSPRIKNQKSSTDTSGLGQTYGWIKEMRSDKVIEVIQAQGSARRGDKVLHHAWTWRNRRRDSAGSAL